MHNQKRILVAVTVLFVLGAFAAFANGQGESSNFSGTVQSITPTGNGNSATVVLNTTNGSYSVTVDQSIVTAAGLQVGKTISLKGVARKLADGSESVDATELEVDGQQYSVNQQIGTAGSSGSSNNQGEAEKPDSHPEQSSKDAETPDTGAKSNDG